MKLLHELINHIPAEAYDKLPAGVDLKTYWETNDAFLNAYDESSTIVLTYRCKYTGLKLKVKVSNFQWYAYCRRSEWINKIPLEKKEDFKKSVNFRSEIFNDYMRLYVKNSSINEMYNDGKEDEKTKLKSFLELYGVEPLEFDLSNAKRFCIDNEIKIADNFKYLFFDIETDDRQDGIVVGRDRILSFAAIDQDNKTKFFILESDTDEHEAEMLESIFDFIYKHDLIVGWNSKNFDVPYLIERYKLHFGKYPSFRDTAHIDFMKRFQKLFHYDLKIRSWSLNFIAGYFLSDEKIKLTAGTYELFETDKKTLKAYNIKDCQLLFDLENKLKVLDLVIKECQWCGCFPSKFFISELLDNYILRYSNKQGVHFKSAKFVSKKDMEELEETEAENIIGGFVKEPTPGLYDNIHIFDFKSLYPSLIMTWNIGLDTVVREEPKNNLDKYIKSVNGFWFKKTKRGMLPGIIEHLLDQRKVYKKIQFASKYGTKEYDSAFATQLIVKEMANSVFGTMAQRGNRYYDKHIAESITLGGHYFLGLTEKLIKEQFGYDSIYGDTDSLFVKKDDSRPIQEVLDYVHGQYDTYLKNEFNIDKSYVELEFEKKFSKFIIIGKKNYVGRLVEIDGKPVDDIYGRGLDYVKKNTIEYGRALQLQLIRSLLYDDMTLEQAVAFIEAEFKKFDTGSFEVSQITIYNKINRLPENYTTKNVVADVAKLMIEQNKEFYVGMLIPYIITNSSPTLTAIHADDYAGQYDKVYYWDKKIYAILKRIVECVYPDYDWCQYEFSTLERRNKKILQYQKWLADPKKKKDAIIEKINADKILSAANKTALIKPKFKLKIKKSEAALSVENAIKLV